MKLLNQLTFEELLGEEKTKKNPPSSPLYSSIRKLLESGVSSALEMCECLIKEGLLSNERYSSNKPKDYPEVCLVLDEMVRQDKVELLEVKEKNDRIYQLKKFH